MNSTQNKIIFKAVKNQDLEELKTLLEGGADVNIQNKNKYTPLHLMYWVWNDSELKIRAMELLISHGADVNIQNEKGNTPLHFACLRWIDSELAYRAMELLLDRGADVNIQNRYGFTPLHYLCWWKDSELTIRAMELLFEHGADVNIQNKNRETPLELAQRYTPISKIAKFLEVWVDCVRVPTLRGLVIRKIRSRSEGGNDFAVPTEQGNVFEGIPKMCLELPNELQSSKEYIHM